MSQDMDREFTITMTSSYRIGQRIVIKTVRVRQSVKTYPNICSNSVLLSASPKKTPGASPKRHPIHVSHAE